MIFEREASSYCTFGTVRVKKDASAFPFGQMGRRKQPHTEGAGRGPATCGKDPDSPRWGSSRGSERAPLPCAAPAAGCVRNVRTQPTGRPEREAPERC